MSDQNYPKGVYHGKVVNRYGVETAIDKNAVVEPLFLSKEGLAGDQCADVRHHGGPDRALHQYPAEHYAYWKEKYGARFNWVAPGMGENLSTVGMTEETVYIGDRYQWGHAIIEVSQPRSPCFKLNRRWEIADFSADMQALGYCGWLYRVIQPGEVSVDKPLVLIERESHAMSIKAVCDIFFADPLNQEKLAALTRQHKLSQSWLKKINQRLSSKKVEDWHFRLFGHANLSA